MSVLSPPQTPKSTSGNSTPLPTMSTTSSIPLSSPTKHVLDAHTSHDVRMDTAKPYFVRDIHMQTARAGDVPDIRMETARGYAPGEPSSGASRPPALKLWERELLEIPEVKRKATVAQLYFFDYYFQTLGYLAARKDRRAKFDADTGSREMTDAEYAREWKSYTGRERVILRKRRAKLRVDQFHIIAQVGQGGYGEVFLARKIETGEVCALKKMRKKTLFKMDEIRHVLVERDILTATKTPWLVQLLYAFQDPQHVYLAMEYVPGGDFRTLLNNSGVLKEEHARFYIAEMFAGVCALHNLGYIHRDLKPENFLVDGTGHVKLTDFGLATGALNPKRIESFKHKLDKMKDTALIYRSTIDRRSLYRSMRNADPRYADSIVGSPDYMAPEVLRGKAYSYSVDYWSLGCILFEFLAGFPPFSGGSPEETWANLKNWTQVLRRPHYDREEDLVFNLTDVAWDCVTRLIAHESVRYKTSAQFQAHPFFSVTPWTSLRSTTPPFVPALDSEIDTGYYDDFSSPEDMAKYAEVLEKQRNVEAVKEKEDRFGRGVWVGFTFGKNGAGGNAERAMRSGLGGMEEEEEGALATIF